MIPCERQGVSGQAQRCVFVVDDDPSVRKSLERLLGACGYCVHTFGSAQEFLSTSSEGEPGCVVLDVRLPDLNGLELQRALGEQDRQLPIVFITGHGDIPMSVRAMKAGAVDFLAKPFSDEALLAAIELALAECEERVRTASELEAMRRKLDSLSPREREVLSRVVAGRLNKQISLELGIAMRTVKLHRARVMQKMDVRTVADLVRLAERSGIWSS